MRLLADLKVGNFDPHSYLFPGRGKGASDRYEKSMETARRRLEADVSSPLAMDGGQSRKPEANN